MVPVVVVLELDGRDGADLAVQASVVEPVDVLGDRDLKVRQALIGRCRPQAAVPVRGGWLRGQGGQGLLSSKRAS